MSQLAVPTRLFTDGLITMLRADVGDGIRVYDARVYGDVSYPYLVVHTIGGPAPDGPPLTGDGTDVCTGYQIDAVGRRRDQADGLADRARTLIVASDGVGGWLHPITVAGWRSAYRRTVGRLGTAAEGQRERELFANRTRYELDWTPD